MGSGIGVRITRNGGRIGGRKQRAARMGRNKALAERIQRRMRCSSGRKTMLLGKE